MQVENRGKPCAVAALLLATLLLSTSVAAVPSIQHWVTDSGARVYFVAAPELPMIDISVTLDAGSARDGDAHGLACLTASVMSEGAGDLDADARADELARLGASVSHECGRDMSSVSLRSLTRPEVLQPALAILAKAIREPRFMEGDIERVRALTLAGLKQQEQSPGSLVGRHFYPALYGDHPYGHETSGNADSVAAITREQMQAFHQRYFQAANAVIAIVGDVDRATAERIAEGLLDCPRGCAPAEPLPKPKPLTQAARLDVPFPSSQAHVRLGVLGMHRGDPDYFKLYVGNQILGGSGLTSLLAKQVREQRGLSYSVYSYLLPYRVDGPFLLGLQTRNETAEVAIEVARDTLAAFIENGPSEKQLRDIKLNLSGGFPLRIDSNSKVAGYLAVIGFYDLPLDYLDRWVKEVESVTAEQIRDAFQRRIHPDRMLTVVVGRGQAK